VHSFQRQDILILCFELYLQFTHVQLLILSPCPGVLSREIIPSAPTFLLCLDAEGDISSRRPSLVHPPPRAFNIHPLEDTYRSPRLHPAGYCGGMNPIFRPRFSSPSHHCPRPRFLPTQGFLWIRPHMYFGSSSLLTRPISLSVGTIAILGFGAAAAFRRIIVVGALRPTG
jgi:hypothetical protein